MGLATLAMLLSIMTLHLVLDDVNSCNEFTGTSREYFIPLSLCETASFISHIACFSIHLLVISLISLICLPFKNV